METAVWPYEATVVVTATAEWAFVITSVNTTKHKFFGKAARLASSAVDFHNVFRHLCKLIDQALAIHLVQDSSGIVISAMQIICFD